MVFLAIIVVSSCGFRTSNSESSENVNSGIWEQYDVLTKTYNSGEQLLTSHTVDLETTEGTIGFFGCHAER